MPTGAVYELAILLSLRDVASGGLDRFEDRLRASGKEGKQLLKTVQDLRKDLRQGLALAGVGIGTLAALKKGVDVAGDFEASMADLRLSIEETSKDGQVNVSKLGNEMDRFEQLGMRLGNALPGSTQDFIQMFAALKQGGLSTNSILEGTGEAVANLAVITHQLPKDLADPFAQYVQQFQLTGKEAMQLSDTLGKLKFSTGLDPQSLIEGSKFFQLRVGSALGYKGLQGAEQGGLFLATLKRYGLEGGLGGREASMFLAHMITQKKALAQVKLKTPLPITCGITLVRLSALSTIGLMTGGHGHDSG
jgi:Phage-related minor tail protein